MERIVARKHVRDLENREILPLNQGGGGSGQENVHGKMQLHLHMTCSKEDAYNRVQFKLLIDQAHSIWSQPNTAYAVDLYVIYAFV